MSTLLILALTTILFKVIPHLPNFSPAIACTVFIATRYPKTIGLPAIIMTALLSDALYAYIHAAPLFGSWNLFTLSGYLLISLAIYQHQALQKITLPFLAIGSAFSFWLWTNFGVWLLDGMYQHNLNGLVQCYTLAVPFLAMDVLAAGLWGALLFIFYIQKKHVQNWSG